MNGAKSNLAGDTMTYVKTATGYHVSDAGPISSDFTDDGKDYPIIADRTQAWTKTGDGVWDIVYKGGGKVLTKAHRVLSADGSTLTTTYEEYRGGGETVHETVVYKRVSGTKGLAGKWKDVKVSAAPDTLIVSEAAGGGYQMEYPTDKVVIVTKGDGAAVPVAGPDVPAGAMASYKAEGPNTWSYTRVFQGKVLGVGTMTVSPDGQSLTDVSWTPGAESEKSTEVYDKK
jgi:hypothetical protein